MHHVVVSLFNVSMSVYSYEVKVYQMLIADM